MVGIEPDLGSSKGTLSSGLEEAKMWTENVKTTPLMDIWHLKIAELDPKFQKYKRLGKNSEVS